MKVQIAIWGNSTAVRLPKAVVRQLGLSQGMTLDVSVDGGAVRLVPVEGTPEPSAITLEWIVSGMRRLGVLRRLGVAPPEVLGKVRAILALLLELTPQQAPT